VAAAAGRRGPARSGATESAKIGTGPYPYPPTTPRAPPLRPNRGPETPDPP